MQDSTSSGCVPSRKTRIYIWLLVGFIPACIYGLTKLRAEPDPARDELLLAITSVSLLGSLWIVILRWEAAEQRRVPRRVRTLLLGLTFFIGFAVVGTFVKWCTGSVRGMYLPIVLSSAPLSALLALVHLGAVAAGSVSAPGSVLDVLAPLHACVLLLGVPVVWGAMVALAAAPHTRRKTGLLVGTALSHYLVGGMIIVLMTAEDWQGLNDTWRDVPWFLTGWGLAYVAAHVLLWRSFLRNRAKKDSVAPVTTPAASAYSRLELGEESADVRKDTLSLTRS